MVVNPSIPHTPNAAAAAAAEPLPGSRRDAGRGNSALGGVRRWDFAAMEKRRQPWCGRARGNSLPRAPALRFPSGNAMG